MFGYVVPAYGKLSPLDASAYRRYYCEGCHQLREGFGLTGTATVNYDMTFNTILLCGLCGEGLDFDGTSRKLCVLEHPHAESEIMRRMAAYTLILTKWELEDDDTDKPSKKTKAISFVLGRAIAKAVEEFPEYDRMVGEGFAALRDLEEAGCRDARLMGRTFGKGLIGALEDIAGDHYSEDLGEMFTELSTAVYIMDAIDDLDQDFMDGTYNPLLPETGYVNARTLVDRDIFEITSLVNATIGELQGRYSRVRPMLKGNVSLCDNIVYYGIPQSAKQVITGDATARASVKNVLTNREARTSKRARRVVPGADVQLEHLLSGPGASAALV